MIKFLDVAAIHEPLVAELKATFARVLEKGQFILGEELAAFEQEFADYCGAAYCVGVGNGLDALSLSLRALGISAGDEVIVPAHTFIATWLSVVSCGAVPVPVEPDPCTFNIDPERIGAAITGKTSAIVPVHLYGSPADMANIQSIADQHGLAVVEDAAQSHGARYGDRRAGSLGTVAAFSFYPAKNLGALGDGGAVTTSDERIYRELLKLRNYGSVEKYQHETLGVNSRLDELQAAFLRLKLRHLDEWNAARASLAQHYMDRLAGVSRITLPASDNLQSNVWHLFVVRTKERDRLARTLADNGIQTVIHYPRAPMFQPAFCRQFPNAEVDFPITRQIQGEVLSLPMGPHLGPADVDVVCNQIVGALDP